MPMFTRVGAKGTNITQTCKLEVNWGILLLQQLLVNLLNEINGDTKIGIQLLDIVGNPIRNARRCSMIIDTFESFQHPAIEASS